MVASFTDAWIETSVKDVIIVEGLVASFTDAWIETVKSGWLREWKEVASFTDAWIETDKEGEVSVANKSHLLQMRGLKPISSQVTLIPTSRIFYRCVD